ncbi:MAG: FAD:protein FMN transferase, partial [Gammaproteobacteria bacterium]|nr:FAD:protein FMN transferase [Gammaproteobacteria bacterium]
MVGGLQTIGDDAHYAFTEDKRHHHILDPRTGVSPLELSSVTV